MKIDKLYELTSQWHKNRGITINGKAETQFLKLVEETGEIAAGMARNKPESVKDGIGDVLVVLVALAELSGTDLEECWSIAYNEIKDRKGRLLPNGNFVKAEDDRASNTEADS